MVSIQHEARKMGALRSLTIHNDSEDCCESDPRSSDEHDRTFGGTKTSAERSQPHTVRGQMNGKLAPIDRQHRILPWWRVNPDGSYAFFVRLGSKPIEFEKGKNAIAVSSLDKIPLVIDILITAVRNGELDDQLAQAKKLPTAARSANAKADG